MRRNKFSPAARRNTVSGASSSAPRPASMSVASIAVTKVVSPTSSAATVETPVKRLQERKPIVPGAAVASPTAAAEAAASTSPTLVHSALARPKATATKRKPTAHVRRFSALPTASSPLQPLVSAAEASGVAVSDAAAPAPVTGAADTPLVA